MDIHAERATDRSEPEVEETISTPHDKRTQRILVELDIITKATQEIQQRAI